MQNSRASFCSFKEVVIFNCDLLDNYYYFGLTWLDIIRTWIQLYAKVSGSGRHNNYLIELSLYILIPARAATISSI